MITMCRGERMSSTQLPEGRSLRILMYSTYFPPQYSGAAKQAIALARYLRERGHHVEFLTVRWAGLAAADTVDGFVVHRLSQGGGRRHREFRLWWNMLRFVVERRNDFDIIHTHGAYYTNSVVGPLSRLVGWRSIAKASLSENDLASVGRDFSGRIHARFLKMIDCCVAISRDLEKEFQDVGLAAHKVRYLPNGVNTERFRPAMPGEKDLLRCELGLPLDRPIALSIGVFDERKNIGWLMEEWVTAQAFGTDALLLAVGPQSREDADGSFLASLKRLAGDNGELLRIKEHVEDIEKYYRAADLFILPSHSEGMPNVVLEAMASGLPCVVTMVSGTEDLMTEGHTGFRFPSGDVAALKACLHRTLGDESAALGSNSRTLMEASYSLSRLAERYEALYRELMGLTAEITGIGA